SGTPVRSCGDHRSREDHRQWNKGRARARHGRRKTRSGDDRESPHPGERLSASHRKGVARMIGSIVRTGWMNLRRDRAAMILSFIVPIVFFSIFAGIFGARRSGTPRVTVVVVDEDHTQRSKRLITQLRAESALKVRD